VGNVGHDLAGGGHRDALFVAQLVQAALLGQDPVPVHTIGGATSQGAQHELVDLHDLLHRLGANVRSTGGTGIHGQENATLELEAQRCGAVIKVDFDAGLVGIGLDLVEVVKGLQKSRLYSEIL